MCDRSDELDEQCNENGKKHNEVLGDVEKKCAALQAAVCEKQKKVEKEADDRDDALNEKAKQNEEGCNKRQGECQKKCADREGELCKRECENNDRNACKERQLCTKLQEEEDELEEWKDNLDAKDKDVERRDCELNKKREELNQQCAEQCKLQEKRDDDADDHCRN